MFILTLWLTAEGANEGAVVADPFCWIWPWNWNVLHQKNTRSHCARSSRDSQRRTVDALLRLCVVLVVCGCICATVLYMYVCLCYRCSTWHDLSSRILWTAIGGVYGQQLACVWWNWERSASLAPRTPSIPERHRNLGSSPRLDCLRSSQPQNRLLPGKKHTATFSSSLTHGLRIKLYSS